jgi:hypothetical protein
LPPLPKLPNFSSEPSYFWVNNEQQVAQSEGLRFASLTINPRKLGELRCAPAASS